MAKGSSGGQGKGGKGGADETVITSPMVDVRATSLFHALSEIEQFSAAELRTDLPDGVVPILPKFSFIDVGMKNALVTTLATFLLAPVTMSVTHYLIPIFGQSKPKLIDEVFVYSFASAPAVAMTLLIGFIAMKVYRGNITKTLTNNLLFTYGMTKIMASIFLMGVGYFIHNRVYTPDHIYSILDFIRPVIEFVQAKIPISLEGTYSFLLAFRGIIVSAVNFAALLHVGTAVLLLISHLVGIQRTRKIELLRKEWE